MAPAPLYSHAGRTRWRLIRLLSSVALAPCATVSAYAQTVTPGPAPAAGAQPAGETRTMDGTTMPGTGTAVPTIRLSGLRFSAFADLSETYTTNVLGVPNGFLAGSSGSDLITTLALSTNVHDHTPRIDADLGYTLSGLLYANNPSFDRISHQLNALARAILIQDRLLFTASAFAAPILINGLGAQGAFGINSGLRDTYGYTVSPNLTFRFGQFARSETLLTQSSVFFVEPGGPRINVIVPGAPGVPDKLVTYGATERISSGPDFYRLNWILTGGFNKTTQPGLDFEDITGNANIRYAFSHSIIAVGVFGYENITSNQNLTRSLGGPTALGGVQLSPTPDLQINATAGWQFDSPSYQGDLRYQIGPFTTLVGSVTDTVTPPASRLIGNLGSLGVNAAGDFINTGFQVGPLAPPSAVSGVSAFNPAPIDGSAITNAVSRFRSANLSLVHISGRTQYRLTGFHTDYDTLTQLGAAVFSPQGKATGVDFIVSRTIRPQLTGSIDAGYTTADDFGSRYSIYTGNISANYTLGARTQAYLVTGYSHRSSSTALAAASPLSADYSEARITIGVRRQLY
jgi:uncharacterized protein (PEP-CTERM system associated)